MTFNDYQQKVDKWIKEYGVRYFNELTNTVILMEEVGEFSRYISRIYGEQSFKKDTDIDDATMLMQQEMADIYFVLTCLANQMNINLEKILSEKLVRMSERDHTRHKRNPKLKEEL